MKTRFARSALAASLSIIVPGFAACFAGAESNGARAMDDGEAEVGVAVDALSLAEVTSVTVTVTGEGIAPPIALDLKKVQSQWRGTIGRIPAGPDRTFTGSARGAANELLYTGQVSGVTISSGAPVSVLLVFQQAAPPTPYANSAPRIASLVVSASQVEPGQSASFVVTAGDPDGDPLFYAWTATGGAIAAATTPAPTWTAPAEIGTYTMSVSVSDLDGAQAGLSFPMSVAAKGSAHVTTEFNTWPVVTLISATPGQLSPGGTTSLAVTASDPEGDPLTYSWIDTCGGTFSDAGAQGPTWTAPDPGPPDAECTLSVSVSDDHGGATTGWLVIGLDLPEATLPPIIEQTFQSVGAAGVGDAVSFEVTASDPGGGALTFDWGATGGTLGTPVTTAVSSAVTWTATAAGSFTVTATVTNAGGAQAVQPFTVDVSGDVVAQPGCAGLPPTCGPAAGESCCASVVVPGGTFNRSNNAAAPATVSDFRLDRFEVTVGRYRAYLAAYPGSKPVAGAGAHPLIAGSGWDPAWDAELPADQAGALNSAKCYGLPNQIVTWTDALGAQETMPMSCLSWYDAFAFCAWDGGRLPTEAEWNYAAAGGSWQRQYPWGTGNLDPAHAAYDCTADGSAGGECTFADIPNVGSRSPVGDARWGQADMAGSTWEWTLDGYATPYAVPCTDCADLISLSYKVVRGGAWRSGGLPLTAARGAYGPVIRNDGMGVRCARTP